MFRWQVLISILAIFGLSNPAIANINHPPESRSPAAVLVADRVLINATGRVSVWMPGQVTTNTREQLSSYSEATRTSYVVIETPPNADLQYLFPQEMRLVMKSTLPGVFNAQGTVVKIEDWEIAGYPGVEAFVRFNNGDLGRFRLFAIADQMFGLGAMTSERFMPETDLFFASFELL